MSVQFVFDFDRALAAMVYMASKPPVTRLDTYKLCKLVFLSDKLHLVRFGRPITGDELRAMEYGPVPSETYDALKAFTGGVDSERSQILSGHFTIDRQYQYPRFQMTHPVDFSYFLSASEMNALDEVAAAHGGKSFDELFILTHAMPAYTAAWDDPERTNRSALMTFEDLFTNDSDAVAGTKEDMLEDFEMRQALRAA